MATGSDVYSMKRDLARQARFCRGFYTEDGNFPINVTTYAFRKFENTIGCMREFQEMLRSTAEV